MDWWVFLSLFVGALIVLLVLRLPVAFAMLGISIVAAIYLYGFGPGLRNLVLSSYRGLATFVLTPIPLFILMGELLFRSGIASKALDVLDQWLGALPGRLAVLATAGGALFGLLSGSTLANTALFGTTVLPQMERAGYSKRLGMGSILASGGLAMVIPPSALVVLWGAIAQVPVGPLLIAGIIPGFIMAAAYLVIILFWSTVLRGAPGRRRETAALPSAKRLRDVAIYVLPLGFIVFCVLGFIFLGVATPTESAALGAAGCVLLLVPYGKFTRSVLRQAFSATVGTTTMILFIVVSSTLYSQVMSFSGATSGLVRTLSQLATNPLVILLLLQLIVILLGLFLDQASIMLVTLPLFMPIVAVQGWDPIWFGILMLINLQIAGTTPPFGLNLFVMKGVAPEDTKMTDIYASAVPFIASDLAVIALLVALPGLVLWLPGFMS